MADNIGGIVKAMFIFPQEIEIMNSTFPSAAIKLKSGCSWKEIKSSKFGINPVVTPQQSDAGILYSVSGTILIPRQNLNDTDMIYCNHLTLLGGIMRYQTANNDDFVIGSILYPLKFLFEIANPNNTTSFSGYKLSLTGKQLSPQLLYRQL